MQYSLSLFRVKVYMLMEMMTAESLVRVLLCVKEKLNDHIVPVYVA